MNSRREFLNKLALAGAFSRLGMINASAQSTGTSDYRALVCVFLFGGNDANNTIVPLGARYQDYANVRGNLAIPAANLLAVNTPSGAAYGLHPALAPIHPLWGQGNLAAVANVGMLVSPTTRQQYQSRTVPVPGNLFSHSDQTSQWQSGNTGGGPSTGWGGRIADRMAIYGVNGTASFPMNASVNGGALLLNGQSTRPATVIPGQTSTGLEGTNPENPAMVARDNALQEILSFDAGFALVQAASSSLKEGIRLAQLINSVTQQNPLTTQFPQSGLGNQLAQVARLIQVRGQLGLRRQIFFCGMGGFDTHSNQLGDHQNLLTQVGQALAAFANSMVELGTTGQVTLFTESEFSRTFQPSQGAGTDHAWGGHHFVMGGGVRGGNVYGTFPELRLQSPDDSGNRGNWIPTLSLDQYGATLASWFGVPAGDLPLIFTNLNNFPVKNIGFMG
ncbi:MAG: DUF1501 domain-containing protein [Bryobacteraceae bacterium]|nr:DUF1501 domain-containing protein [Bryobacteraceae bacterium]